MSRDVLISTAYLHEQIKLHGCGYYGAYSDKWAPQVLALSEYLGATSVLDYGCGQGKLLQALRGLNPALHVDGYDPAVPIYAELPEAADLVVCTDVLEHIEPDCLAAVLAHMASVTGRWMFGVIATRPATRKLSNGQNAHMIIETSKWWSDTLANHGWRPRTIPVDLSGVYDPALEFAGLWQPPAVRSAHDSV